MNKYIVLLLLLLTGFTVTDVRKEMISLDWHAVCEPGNKLGYSFSNAGYGFPSAQIPCFFRSWSLEGPGHDIQFVLEDPVFAEIEPKDSHFPLNELPGEPEIKKTRLRSGRDYKVEIQIPAVIRREGKILLLKKFELKQFPVRYKSAAARRHEWESSSVLKEGKWVRISTSGKGIYAIPWSKLTDWGFSNPSQVNIFGAGGMILPEDPGNIPYDDLPRLAVWQGKNNGTDCLFFYAPGTIEWKPETSGFEHRLHPYTVKGHFFLTESAGAMKNMEQISGVIKTPTHTITSFDDFRLIKTEKYNLIHSGKQWFGDKFIHSTTRNYTFEVADADPAANLTFRINAAGRSSAASEMLVMADQSTLGKISFSSVNTSDNTSWYANEKSSRFTLTPRSGNIELLLRYSAFGPNPEAWLDFIELNFRRKLKVNNNEVLFFRDKNSAGNGNILEFRLEPAASGLKVWDVTDVFNVKEVPLQFDNNIAKGIRSSSLLREYAAFYPNGNFPEPELVGEVANQNLHGLSTPEYLIITSPVFLQQAKELADFHRSHDGMQIEVVTTTQVYNEFSSGNKDATGIRNFIKMFYDRNEGLKYVLLFGDGSYDNKNINAESTAFIPTYQSAVSLDPVGSFVSDDYFVLLDAGESVYNGAVDLGIGRIPAATAFQADLMVKKIRDYYSPEAMGNWRNVVCFIADDEDNNLHMVDSEKLSNQVNESHSEFFIDKIYFDAYRQISGPGGESYPDATEAINQRVKDGVLILNYLGHANERFLAHEKVLDISHINSWPNAKNLPIFVTATCEFSRFDADDTSAGEYILFNSNGGGIGLFSTTRLVFAYSNYLLSRNFYRFVFGRDDNGEHYRMGDIMRLAKINTINTINKRNFTLLTDPALKLSWPKHGVITSTLNGHAASEIPDTLGILEKVTISGFIADEYENKVNNFNGQIIPLVLDKAVKMKTRGNANETPLEFHVQENVIYKGLAEVINGEFTFSFVVPKDISYNPGQGKIIYYADNGEEDAHGSYENFLVGGAGSQITDNQGPEIELFMDTREFTPGGCVSKNPILLAELYDENGINTVGSGIGHDITAVLNNDYSNVMILNNYYQASEGDFTSGIIRFPLKNLPEGKHLLKLKAWDVANNSTETGIEFEVTGDFVISQVTNYPNPVYDHTFFTFEHNQADAVLETIFEVFDQNGRRIDYITEEVGSNGNISNPVRWDLNEAKIQLRSGIYLFRITAQNADGMITSGSGKLIVAR
jgi:hypothetical protein